MLDFFGMKEPVTGPNACFQYIESSEQQQSEAKRSHRNIIDRKDILPQDEQYSITKHREIDVANFYDKNKVTKNGNELNEVLCCEPGPEHLGDTAMATKSFADRSYSLIGGISSREMTIEEGIMPQTATENNESVDINNQFRVGITGQRHYHVRNSSFLLQPHQPGPELLFYEDSINAQNENQMHQKEEQVHKKYCEEESYKETAEEGVRAVIGVIAHQRATTVDAEDEGANQIRDAVNHLLQQQHHNQRPSLKSKQQQSITVDNTLLNSYHIAATQADCSSSGAQKLVSISNRKKLSTIEKLMANASVASDSGNDTTFILIKSVKIINDDAMFSADVLIEDQYIRQISSKIEAPKEAFVIDGTGKALLPAGVDFCTNLANHVGDFETGSRAALTGGTTTIVTVVQATPNESLLVAYNRMRKAAEAKSHCNIAFSILISSWNDVIKKEMSILVKDKGVNSFVVGVKLDEQLFEIFDYCRLLRVHARVIPENKAIISILEKRLSASGITGSKCFSQSRPGSLEADMVNRVSVLSKLSNCPIAVMSLSSPEAAEAMLRVHSSTVLPEVSVASIMEVNPMTLSTTNKVWVNSSSFRYFCPHTALFDCISSIPFCTCVSDQRVFCGEERGLSAPQMCATSVKNRMPFLWEKCVLTGIIDPMRFVAVTSSNLAKIFNLYPKKGRIAVGADADVVLWDLTVKPLVNGQEEFISSTLDTKKTGSKPTVTICGGRIVSDEKPSSCLGKFLELASNSPYIYCIVEQLEKIGLSTAESNEVKTSKDGKEEEEHGAVHLLPAKNVRSQFDSSVSADTHNVRASTKVLNPPGGRSTGFW